MRVFLTLALVVIFINGCSTINVTVDYDSLNDFSEYETYKIIIPKKSKEENSIYLNNLNQKRIVNNIEDVLSQKGFDSVTEDYADFGVVYHLRFDKKLDITGYGYKYHPISGYRERYIQARTYQQGSIILDIIDRRQKLLVWRGVAEGVLRETDNPEKVLKNAIRQILESFPPTK